MLTFIFTVRFHLDSNKKHFHGPRTNWTKLSYYNLHSWVPTVHGLFVNTVQLSHVGQMQFAFLMLGHWSINGVHVGWRPRSWAPCAMLLSLSTHTNARFPVSARNSGSLTSPTYFHCLWSLKQFTVRKPPEAPFPHLWCPLNKRDQCGGSLHCR